MKLALKYLDKFIRKDQTVFISGRFIGENISFIYDIMNFCNFVTKLLKVEQSFPK